MKNILASFPFPRLRGEVDAPTRSGGVSGEGGHQYSSIADMPLTRLAASLLATLSPLRGAREEGAAA